MSPLFAFFLGVAAGAFIHFHLGQVEFHSWQRSSQQDFHFPLEEERSQHTCTSRTNLDSLSTRALPQQYEFALVSDLDQSSRHPTRFEWHSFLQKGTLKRSASGNFSIEWGELIKLSSTTANKNRSMELSELVLSTSQHKKRLLGMCDYTGIIYEISPSGKVFQRHAVADGNGRDPKPFKIEWATEKDGLLYIGSFGKEWTRDGAPVHYNPEWVKTLDSCGRLQNIDWNEQYQALRRATNCTYPGYLWHEAVVWHEGISKWLFLPRKESHQTPYDEVLDHHLSSNLLLIASEDFSDIIVKRIGPLECEFGFTSMKLVPDTMEIMATKVREVGNQTETYITVFDLEGKFYLEPWQETVSTTMKFEGLAFL